LAVIGDGRRQRRAMSSARADAAEVYSRGFVAELGDGGGEAFGVHAGGFVQGTVPVDALTTVGDDQGHPRSPFRCSSPRLESGLEQRWGQVRRARYEDAERY
jgi:hypothetical protein